jgi:adenosine deaminase/adenosine deaminase CECR1
VGDYEAHRQLLRYWSNLDFVPGPVASYDDFFDTFGRFWVGEGPNFGLEGLLELKARAEAENVDYIETMLFRVKPLPNLPEADTYDRIMRSLQEAQDEVALDSIFRVLTARFEQLDFSSVVDAHNRRVEGLHEAVFPADAFHGCIFRYQNYAVRVQPPARLFAELYADFLSASRSDLIVGVNIVAPEHDPIPLADYWLQMQMFRFLKRQFPQVRTSLHAGELRLGLVAPEDLTWHIRAAVEIAGADRIGHGVDIAHERDPYRLLALLLDRNIAVEINLESNAFILGVEGAEHPFMFYHRARVPLVISTDDAGVLRTNLTAQYVKLAQDYPELSYRDIKKLARNSITYSFLDVNTKRTLLNKLNQAFQSFELTVIRQW